MGMGIDLHGRDATKAARARGVRRNPAFEPWFHPRDGKTAHDMIVEVIGVLDPSAGRYGRRRKSLRKSDGDGGGGGLSTERGDDAITIANAAVLVSIEVDG